MNIEYLKLFIRAAALNNISLAGKEFGFSPAVASAHLKKLEEDLKTRLLHRTTRKVSLTEEGIAFLPHALNILETIDTARQSMGHHHKLPQGKLRIAASASFGRMHIVPYLNEFLTTYPDLTIDLSLSDTIVNMVEGGFDIAIRDTKLTDSSLIARKLCDVHRFICASPEYLQQYGKPETPNQLKGHNCINLTGMENWHFQSENTSLTIKTTTKLWTDNGEAARDACLSGIGIAQISDWNCAHWIESGELIPILTNYPLLSGTSIWAVYPSTRLLAPKVRAFIDYYLKILKTTPWHSTL